MASKLTVEQFAADVARVLGERLVALLLYGSWARGTHVPGRSDVNTLLICDAVDQSLFETLAPAVRDWTRAGQPAPLILTEREWRGAPGRAPLQKAGKRGAAPLLAGRRPRPGLPGGPGPFRGPPRRQRVGELVCVRAGGA